MYNNGPSWGWIVFWFIFFWPVGLILLIKKLSTDNRAFMSGKVTGLTVMGWIFNVFGAVMLLGSILDSSARGLAVVAVLLLIGGIALLRRASKVKKASARYQKYMDIVVSQNVKSLDQISAAVGLPYGVVEKDLQHMIQIGFLQGAYIHLESREIIVRQNPFFSAHAPVGGIGMPQTVAARCPGCGANNTLTVGKASECEYCGTPISV